MARASSRTKRPAPEIAEPLVVLDMYLQIGAGPVTHHRVWDGPRFVASVREQVAREQPFTAVFVRSRREYLEAKAHGNA